MPTTKPPESILSFFSKKSSHNEPKVDNRLAYLVLKASILRVLKQANEAREILAVSSHWSRCFACFFFFTHTKRWKSSKKKIQEIISRQQILQDKLWLALAYTVLGKTYLREDPQEASKNLQLVLNMRGLLWEGSIKGHARAVMRKTGKVQVIEEEDEDDDEELEQLKQDETMKELLQSKDE